MLDTPAPIRTLKLSMIGPGQCLDWSLLGILVLLVGVQILIMLIGKWRVLNLSSSVRQM